MRSTYILSLLAAAIFSQAAPLNLSVTETADKYRRAVLAGDVVALGETYREDAIEMSPGRPMLRGRSAIEQCYRELFKSSVKITAFTFSYLDTFTSGDLGYVAGLYQQKVSGGPAGPAEDMGKFVVVVKRDHGAWRSAYTIYNSDRAPAQPAAALPVAFPQKDLARLFVQQSHTGLIALGAVVLTAISLLILSFCWSARTV